MEGNSRTENRETKQEKFGSVSSLTKENATKSNAIEIPSISLPKGGGALKGIDEKFEVNAANGTASFSIPLPATPGRNGFGPSLSLSYNSGGGNSPFGLGWSVGLPSIQRKTDRNIPRYRDDDVFLFSGAEDLVPVLENENGTEWKIKEEPHDKFTARKYRPRIEGGFARIERIEPKDSDKGIYWRVTTRENVTTVFGRSNETRIVNSEDKNQIYQWLPELSYDDKGNCMVFEYKLENLENVPDILYEQNRKEGIARFTNQYIKSVRYGNLTPYYAVRKGKNDDPYNPRLPDGGFLFELVFDYGEHSDNAQPHLKPSLWNYRNDAFSSYRSGFEIRTNRLCKRILMFHHFEDENQFIGTSDEEKFGNDYLVRSLDLNHECPKKGSIPTEVTYLCSIIQRGYIRKGNGYFEDNLPPIEFEYQKLQWNTAIKKVDSESIINAPVGLTNNYQWADLYGEGISGILTEQGQGWYYKPNYGDTQEDGNVKFGPAKKVAPRPSFSGLSNGSLILQDLESNGQKQIVVNYGAVQGYFELAEDEDWKPFQTFDAIANLNLQDPHTRLLDLTGDGQPDIVMTEENVFSWHEAKGKKGHRPAAHTAKPFDENLGPAIVFADQEQSIFLADFSGDGLTDIVRIKNGEVCYWANKGYGRFSAKVEMGNAPYFDHPELFNPKYLHLADVSGTGATDIIYLGQNTFKAFINLSGNAFSDAHEVEPFYPIDSNSKLSVIDLLGSGTSCIVWSSDLPGYADAPMRYIDLMDSKKPHVLVAYRNNMGKETSFNYKSSTHYYIQDKLKGTPWKTKLSFPVQVVSEMIVKERITDVSFSTGYTYHNGYYDHTEREFRGFGRVEQLDTEEYGTWSKKDNQLEKSEELYQALVLTKTWFHTGAFLSDKNLLKQFEDEYWYHLKDGLDMASIPEYVGKLPAGQILGAAEMTAEELREAHRACKGMMLRQEVFSLEGNPELHGIPYTVATHNCHVKQLQHKATNKHGVFLNTESEAITFQYERDYTDARIAHSLNIKIDELGNILERAAVVYPRVNKEPIESFVKEINRLAYERPREKGACLSHLETLVKKQKETLITYTVNSFTKDIKTEENYRLRQPDSIKTYELGGISIPRDSNLYRLDSFVLDFSNKSDEKKYNQSLDGVEGYRLIEHIVSRYYDDNIGKGLPEGEMASHGLPYEAYQLAFTREMLETTYGTKIDDPKALLETGGKYVKLEPDEDIWWIPSGYPIFKNDNETLADVKKRFFTPLQYNSPFDSVTEIKFYKDYWLFPNVTIDAVKNRTEVTHFNFRTLAPIAMKDINENSSEVLLDELGLVKAIAVLGQATKEEGDNLDGLTEYTTQEEKEQISKYLHLTQAEELRTAARGLLQKASTRLVYDFKRFQNSYELLQEQLAIKEEPCAITKYIPTIVGSIVRELHHQDILNDPDIAQSPLQLSFEYSDGLGNVAMQKTQAEPGDALQLQIKSNCNFEIKTITVTENELRWIGNGRTVLNNKGNPVKQYEPYFSVNPFYEDYKELVERGVTPILYYDALGRNIQTIFPDGTKNRITFTAWEHKQYDQNDCDIENRAYDTPNILHLDTLGRPILSIAHNRIEKSDGQDGIIDNEAKNEFYNTLINLDIEGNALEILDARGNRVMEYNYDMLGNRIYENSMDTGERWSLTNVVGNPIHHWDSKKQIFSSEYDAVQRPIAQWLSRDGGSTTFQIKKMVYGEDAPSDKAKNLRGQIQQHYDSSGLMENLRFDFKGNLLESARRFPIFEKTEIIDWSQIIALKDETFTLKTQYDALNRMRLLFNWHRTEDKVAVYKPEYNERGVLKSEYHFTGVTINGDSLDQTAKPTPAITKVEYDEKGQRTYLKLGNHTTTRYTYDSKNFRLAQLKTTRKMPTAPNELPVKVATGLKNYEILQDLHYTYDAIGNIVRLENKAQEDVNNNNSMVEPICTYRYDALDRLVYASGRENKSFDKAPTCKEPAPVDLYNSSGNNVFRKYRQLYHYDAVGNIEKMKHVGNDDKRWTRNYRSAEKSNRLLKTWHGNNEASATVYEYNDHGSMLNCCDSLQPEWDYRERVFQLNLGGGGVAYYQYDSQLERSRKIIENTGGLKEERLYLGGMELYRRWQGNTLLEEIETHHLMLDDQRVLLVDDVAKTDNNSLGIVTLYKYQYSNHLGSVGMELNHEAKIISYEEYHPYGTVAYHAKDQAIKATAKRFRYTGMERDSESGLNYHSARYYLPWLGRWLSTDPIGIKDGLNIISYTNNKPIKLRDQNGMQKEGRNEDSVFSNAKSLIQYGAEVESLGKSYNAELEKTQKKAYKMLENGRSERSTAKWLVKQRTQIRAKYVEKSSFLLKRTNKILDKLKGVTLNTQHYNSLRQKLRNSGLPKKMIDKFLIANKSRSGITIGFAGNILKRLGGFMLIFERPERDYWPKSDVPNTEEEKIQAESARLKYNIPASAMIDKYGRKIGYVPQDGPHILDSELGDHEGGRLMSYYLSMTYHHEGKKWTIPAIIPSKTKRAFKKIDDDLSRFTNRLNRCLMNLSRCHGGL